MVFKKFNLMQSIKFIFLLFAFQLTAQQGGMFIPSLLEGLNEKEIKNLGGNLSASDIYNVNSSSLKDAIGHFNGGCTSEVISPNGLLLTNHHCGYYQIQSHSSVEKDYLKDGFWAKNLSEELPNKNLYVEFIVRIEDVTDQALEGVTDDMNERERQAKINGNTNAVEKSAKKEAWQDVRTKAFYKGNQYFLFVTERYTDIRLVGTPPSSIGKFGSDTDNWVWPRHTGDFSLFRIYADKNNRPADYSKDNVPFTPKHFLPVSLKGVKEGDFTLVFGFPGTTDEYLPAIAVEQITEKINPSNIAIREAALKVMDSAMKANNKIKIQYASKQAGIANYWKKWIGENQGLKATDAVEKKRAFEKDFTEALSAQNKEETYGHILPELKKLYTEIEPITVKRSNFVEVFIRNNELMRTMFYLFQLENAATKGEAVYNEAKDRVLNNVKNLQKNFNTEIDKRVFKAIMPFYTDNLGKDIYVNTAFIDSTKAVQLLTGTPEEVQNKIQSDAAYQFARPYFIEFYGNIEPKFRQINDQINGLEQQYMKAMMEVLPDQRYFPDANGTLRVTYGQVKGYSPRDAVYYEPVTHLEGVMEKYIPGDYEFDVPEKLRTLYQTKDYGKYADANGNMPVCFIGTNHTTGGNSGSPAIDADGNLIGLNFDRVWEGTMSDYYYDPAICRNIMVDIRYILFIMDKYAGARHLIEEMELVE